MLVGTTYYLLKNPSTLAKLTSEIRNKFTSLSEITNQSTTNLEYLNAVINEGLRIFPPVSGHLERTSPGAVVDEKWIPKGTHVHVCARTMTRSPKYWKNGDTFIPERWIGKNDEDVLEASKPFSIGPRGCIGKNLAYMEMRMILAKLVWRFDLELVNEREEAGKWGWLEDARVIGMWVKPDLWLKFTKREQEEKS